MTFSKSDFPHIKKSLLTFLFTLGVVSVMIVASNKFVTQAQRDQREANRQLVDARNRLATAGEDQKNMRTYTLEYNALLERNVIGNDQRLDWIEGLDRIHKQGHRALGSMDFQYSIAPQKAYAPTPPVDSGNFELNRSDMTLHFELLHEEQLMAFFSTLRTDLKGWFILDQCALERSATAPEKDDFGVAEQLKAECTGGWLTLKNRNAK